MTIIGTYLMIIGTYFESVAKDMIHQWTYSYSMSVVVSVGCEGVENIIAMINTSVTHPCK